MNKGHGKKKGDSRYQDLSPVSRAFREEDWGESSKAHECTREEGDQENAEDQMLSTRGEVSAED